MGLGIGAFTPLYSQILSSQTSSITFSNISNDYKHLMIVITGYGTSDNQVVGVRVNGDSGTNYSTTRFLSYSAGTITDRYANATYFMSAANFSNIGTTTCITYIYDYSNANKYKTFYALTSDNSESVSRDVGLWRSYAGINSITLFVSSTGNFVVGTTATVYGIKDSSSANIQGLFTRATGGNDVLITQDGYKNHIFTTSGNLFVSNGGTIDYLIVAGGAGGGAGLSSSTIGSGGGGGAGGMLTGSTTVTTNTNYQILIGGGGGGASTSPAFDSSYGSNSSAFSLTAIGGGAGGSYGGRVSAGTGGSGGGGYYGGYTGASGTAGQGNSGGNAANLSPAYGHGGGGGKGSVGGNGSGTAGGNGGSGSEWPASSGKLYAAGGGGGSGSESYQGGTGGSSIGGNGSTGTAAASNAIANTGSGGGGSGNRGVGGTLGGLAGNGSSGIVIVRYPLS